MNSVAGTIRCGPDGEDDPMPATIRSSAVLGVVGDALSAAGHALKDPG
jgi:hypothetical protein